MTEDATQLRRFVESGDEEAFRALVCRHFGLVYGAALRLTNRDAALAQDVAQSVFTDLARKAGLLRSDVVLAGWLYQATRFAAAKAVRSEQRRRAREKEAFAMQDRESEPSSPEWDRIGPVLDAAMGRLNAKDRHAVLLHYIEQKNFRSVGAALGISDDAAQKRVSRALDKLRSLLARGGVAVSGSALSTFLSAGTLPSMPASMPLAVAKSSLAASVAMGPPGWTTVFIHNLALVKVRLAMACLLFLLTGGVLTYLFYGAHPVNNGAFVPVDLSAHYNGGLDKSWTPAYGNNYLSDLGEGRKVLKRVPFEIHGVVQLQGAEWKRRGYDYPESIEGIRIGMEGRKIHLLHANSAFEDPMGTVVASLIVHYSDGNQTNFSIRQGIEVMDWWEWPRALKNHPTDTNTLVAWSGSNPAAEHQGARIRLFDTVFINPHPEKEIQSIDYVSGMAGSAPFMVAMTIEH
jgi:RNA polymerase sigma factor (sigma-70 family)